MPHAIIPEAKKRRTKILRRDVTMAERRLWHALRAHRFESLGFRRQVPLGRYVVDFACHARRIVVETDGGQHFSGLGAARDEMRDRWLRTQGYRVVRISNNDVLGNLDGVLQFLLNIAANSPLPPCGEARPRLARSEGGARTSQSKRLIPLPTLPHKGRGIIAARSINAGSASAPGEEQR